MKKNKYRIAVALSNYNPEISEGLLKGAVKVLGEYGIPKKRISIFRCPGSFEIPLTVKRICESEKYDAVVCLGAVIKGETAHFEYISNTVSNGIAKLSLEYDTPVAFGVLTCYTKEQALRRSSDDSYNKGAEAARSALEMLNLLKSI